MDRKSALSYISSQFGLSGEKALKIVKITEASINSLLDKSKEALLKGDKETLAYTMHTLKTNFANLGLKELFEKAKDIESKLKQGEDIDIQEAFSEILSLWNKIKL